MNAHYVILELYAQGNILLTDSEFTVLTLLRSHRLVISSLLYICFHLEIMQKHTHTYTATLKRNH